MIFASAFLPGIAMAQTHELAPPPACTNNKDEKVTFSINQRSRDPAAPAFGSARRDPKGQPVVYRFNFRAAAPELQRFILLHECAHHQTGDVDRPHPPRNGPVHLFNEAVSDCIAAMRLRDENGYDDARLAKLTAALRTDMEKVGFQTGYIADRIRNLASCFKRDGSAQDLIDARLKERGLLGK